MRRTTARRFGWIALIGVGGVACSSHQPEDHRERLLRNHVIAFDSSGSPVDPAGDEGELDFDQVTKQIDRIVERMEGWLEVAASRPGEPIENLAGRVEEVLTKKGSAHAGAEREVDSSLATLRNVHWQIHDWLLQNGLLSEEAQPTAQEAELLALFERLEAQLSPDERLYFVDPAPSAAEADSRDLANAADDVSSVLKGVRRYCREQTVRRDDARAPIPRRGVMVFVHGGLNDLGASRKRAQGYARDVLRTGYYPIFVSWDSGLASSYRDNLVYEDGDASLIAFLASPYRVATDIVDGVLDVPRRFFGWGIDVLVHATWLLGWTDDGAYGSRDLADQAMQRLIAEGNVDVTDGHFESDGFFDYLRYSWWSPTQLLAPVRMVTWIPVQLFGAPAWQGMLRNSERLTNRSPSELVDGLEKRPLLTLLDRLARVEAAHPELEFILVGHSMGTIISNDILRRSLWDRAPQFERVVYMAAACTVKDYEESALPYLERHCSEFYHLVLHPDSELTEVNAAYLGPQGSLLVFLDHALTSPITRRDRTLGRYENLLPSLLDLSETVASRIHLRVMDAGSSARAPFRKQMLSDLALEDEIDDAGFAKELALPLPECHGDFSHLGFWTRAFRGEARPVPPGKGDRIGE